MAANTKSVLLVILLNFLTLSLGTQDDLVISTSDGKIQGKLLSVLGSDVRAFLGIPYGKPPVGKLRFRVPEPVEKWDGVKDATKFPNSCYQMPDLAFPGFKGIEMWNPNTPLSEDCLYLNVWSPRFNKTQPAPLAPVFVWIHGGAFISGTSSLDIYDGRFLSKSESVVVVSMNYRLGAFGFLSLPDNTNIPGNAGLLDQRLALKWVANNIAAFGGDPSKVTLFGESAGSASVGFQLLSPGSQDLFQRAVMQSGSPNAYWATISQTEKLVCSRLILKKISTKQFEVLTQPSLLSLPFTPHVDGNFLPDAVDVLLSTGNFAKKDVMFGLNKDEGTYFVVYGVPGFNITGQSLITRNEFLAGVLLAMDTVNDVTRDAAIFHYTDWMDEDNRMKNRDSLCSLVGDQMFICPVLDFAHRLSQHGGKPFVYLFDHHSSINPWPEWMGAIHGYEIEFVFGMPLNTSLGYTKEEVNMTKKFMKHWANFARTGNPGLEGAKWPVFTVEEQKYVTLNYKHPEEKTMMRAKECQLWSKFIPKVQSMSGWIHKHPHTYMHHTYIKITLYINDFIALLVQMS
uniref:Carboxylic ester hydrolase n=1 Tax=Oreochromis niloticus TaxID=8128 RepID=A0A669DHP0_ORENI